MFTIVTRRNRKTRRISIARRNRRTRSRNNSRGMIVSIIRIKRISSNSIMGSFSGISKGLWVGLVGPGKWGRGPIVQVLGVGGGGYE